MYSHSTTLDLQMSDALFECSTTTLNYANHLAGKIDAVTSTSDARAGAFYIKQAV